MEIIDVLLAGLNALQVYLSAHVLTCLVPAFFIAGAMSALLPKERITKYLGKNVPKYKAYPLSVVAGLLLAVCSCTVLPLFAGIKKKGAGIGPAIAFLYTAPATNILAIIYTGSLIGWDLAAARIILSVTFAVLIGIIISKLFKEKDDDNNESTVQITNEHDLITTGSQKGIRGSLRKHSLLIFFATWFALLILGASKINDNIKIIGLIILAALVLIELKFYFKGEKIKSWLNETWMFFKKIFPLLLIGIFAAGILTALIPQNLLANYVGTNTVIANLIAVLFGVFMYFPTLVEVPMAKMFLTLGMARGPLLAYLLADPVISLPSILVVRKIMGTKRTLTYALLITIFCTIAGLIYGFFTGVLQ